MSKKQLLTEGEIRRFMKYANLGPLSENFLSETYMEEEEGYGHMQEEEGMDDMGGEEEMPAEEPAPAPSGDLSVDEGDLAQMIKDAVKAALAEAGVGEGEAAPEEEFDMDVMGGEAAPEGDDDEEEMEEAHYPMDEARIVSEVARRVMARLSESRKPQARPARAPARRSRAAAINEVTDRIMKRILKGK
jgi:hypothetical protein